MSRINILFDTNYLFRKTLGIFAGYGAVNPAEVFSREEDQSAFIRKVTTDMCATLRSLPSPSRIVMCADSSSWRKKVEIVGGGYKSNRKKDANVDWSIFFSIMDQLCGRLEELGYHYTKIRESEADDLIYFWSRYLLTKGENSIIVTGDSDLHQLIKFTDSKNWVCVLNNNSKNLSFYHAPKWKESIETDEVSIFNMSDSIDPSKSKLKEIISGVKTVEIEVFDILFNKIISGDEGDAIPPVWIMQKGGKNYGITKKKAESLLNEIKNSKWKDLSISELLNNEESLDFISGFCLRCIGDVDSQENRTLLTNNIQRNKTLVWLDKEVIPKELSLEVLNEITEKSGICPFILPTDKDSILKGTPWITEGYVPKKFDPFAL